MKDDAAALSCVVDRVLPATPTLWVAADASRFSSWQGRIKRFFDVLFAMLALTLMKQMMM